MISEGKELIESSGKLGFHYTRYDEFDSEPARLSRVGAEVYTRLVYIPIPDRPKNGRGRVFLDDFLDDKVNIVVCPDSRSKHSAHTVAKIEERLCKPPIRKDYRYVGPIPISGFRDYDKPKHWSVA